MFRKVFLIVVVLASVSSAATVRADDDDEAEANLWTLGPEAYLVSQPAPNLATGEAVPRATRSSARSSYARLSRAPNMYGDSISTVGQVQVTVQQLNGTQLQSFADLPLGGGRALKVAENNKALPMDRVYFVYNGFQNAASVRTMGVPADANLNRYTFGFEKTFLDGQWSLDARLPMTDSFRSADPALAFNSGNFGNLALFLKHLCFSSDSLSVVAGLGAGLPTGSDIDGRIGMQPFTLRNQAVHLVPYIGFLSLPSDNWFLQGFLDVDFAANGNPVDVGAVPVRIGTLTEQNLLHADLSVGRWLMRNEEATYLTGIAAVTELHYTSTIQNSDRLPFTVPGVVGGPPGGFGEFRNFANRQDFLNLTAGLQFQIGHLSNLRVACVVPVRNAPDRQFDAEIQVSFNRFF